AEEVALALLACAPPEPVEVAPDADPAHGLTERLRSQARADLDDEPALGPRAASRRSARGPSRPSSRGTSRRPGGRCTGGAWLRPTVLAAASLRLVLAAVALVRPQLVEARSGTTDPAPTSTADPASPPAVDPASPPTAAQNGHPPTGTSGSSRV